MPSWTETRLWQQLTNSPSPETPSIQGLLQQCMPQIETVLNAGTAPLDFTLHDKEHSYRVAEWMAKIVPEDVLPKLSAYELALLLLSAYLHDIGMTPEQARVQRHWRHLVFGSAPEEEGGLSPKEADDFQTWLDDERSGIVPPLARDGKAGEDDFRLAAELITYYARHKHNDWSGEWIRKNATGVLGSYEPWVEDLVHLCQSHHQVYADLVKDAFDPRLAGRHGEVVHLRYLACVLRVADILDVDPERTPPVLFQHRDIAPKSVIYWYKDHDLSVHPDGSFLVVHARPRSAVVEKAVRDTAEWIQFELETCTRLDREKPFSYSSFRTSQPLPHRWDFPASIQRDIRPRNDDYVYIDGAFRPNTAKLLELLSGIQLYKEPLAAVRELLQNAFDAVKEQIALERLGGDPGDTKRTDAITALQSVKLRFEEREGRFWLLCTDSGVGMTRPIIEKYLLVSGSSRRHDILELERRCEAAGFRLGRTGQFGIGVLSYFMLADRVEISTRRSAERGDEEPNGWEFQTEGVGAFGELRRNSQRRHGTTVGLRLRRDVVANREEFLSRLQEYLLDTLLRIPCSLQLLVEGEAGPRLRIEAGWQSLTSRLVDDFLRAAEERYSRRSSHFPGNKVPKSLLERRDLALREWSGVVERFRSAIRWKTKTGHLPNRIGHYRLSVPFFQLPGGKSSLFFDFDPADHDIARPLPLFNNTSSISLALRLQRQNSFQGMRVKGALLKEERFSQILQPYLIEIDWEDPRAGQITVDRSTFSLTPEALNAIYWLKSRGEEFHAIVLSEGLSDYAELNAFLNPLIPPPSETRWFVNSPDHKGLRWATFSSPALSSFDTGDAVHARGSVRSVSITQAFVTYTGEVNTLEWCTGTTSRSCPDRPVVVRTSPLAIITQYIDLPRKLRKDDALFKGEFPPVWSALAALGNNSEGRTPWLWNRDYPLIQMVETQDLEWFASFKLWQLSEDLLQSRGRSALFLLKVLETLDPGKYIELAEDFRAGFWHDIWDRVAVVPAEIAAWVQYPPDEEEFNGSLFVLRPENIEWIPATDPRIPQYLPDPGDEWKLTLIFKDGDDSADT